MGTPVSNSFRNFLWNYLCHWLICNDFVCWNGVAYPQEYLVGGNCKDWKESNRDKCEKLSRNDMNFYHVVGDSRKRRGARRIRRARRHCKYQLNKLFYFFKGQRSLWQHAFALSVFESGLLLSLSQYKEYYLEIFPLIRPIPCILISTLISLRWQSLPLTWQLAPSLAYSERHLYFT